MESYLMIRDWKRNGCPNPPPHIIKQRNICQMRRKHKIRTLVETGTYQGDMIAAMQNQFDTLYSIELSPSFFHKAKIRFANNPRVILQFGDSGTEIKKIMNILKGPALFWLDGHFSGGETARGSSDTPIIQELQHVLASSEPRHIILIDDARLFGTDPAYPSLQDIEAIVAQSRTPKVFSIKDDCIFIEPSP